MSDDAFLVGGVRTPIGRCGGALAKVRSDDLAALVLRDVRVGVGQGVALLVERV